jgi:hypothetical protein
VDDGAEWRPHIHGKLGKQPPLVADFDGQYQSATFADQAGAIVATCTVAGGTASGLVQAKDEQCTLTVHVRSTTLDDNGYAGLVVRDSGSQRQLICGVASNAIGVYLFDNDTTPITSFYYREQNTGPFWFRFVDDGVNFNFYHSVDGSTWQLIHQQTRDAYVPGGGDQIGVALDLSGGPYALFDSYEYTTP